MADTPQRETQTPSIVKSALKELGRELEKMKPKAIDTVEAQTLFGYTNYKDDHGNKLIQHWFDPGYDAQCSNGVTLRNVSEIVTQVRNGTRRDDSTATRAYFEFEGRYNPLATACNNALKPTKSR